MKSVFHPIRTLNQRTFKKNRGRNLAAVTAILLTAMMFTTLLTLAQSMRENLIAMTFRQVGYDAHVSFKSITPEQAALIAAHPDIKEMGDSIVLGIAENSGLAGRQVEIRWGSDSYAGHSFAMPSVGRMPQSADEIALDTIILDRLGLPHELEQTVTLEWHRSPDEKEVSSFSLCGFYEGNESSYASMAWVSRDYAEQMTGGVWNQPGQILGVYMAQFSLYDDSSIGDEMDRILADVGLTELEYSVNLAYSPEMGATASQETLPMYLGMALVFIAGYLIIYNIFQIGVTADVQFYGKLKTLGTSKKQLKRLIYGQANRLCLIGIPAGLLLGWLLGLVLVPAFTGILEGESTVSVNPLIFIGSALFAWLTVTVSCLRPARLAGRISPIEALRMSDADGMGRKRARRRPYGASDGKSRKKARQRPDSDADGMGRKRARRRPDGASLAGMAWANLGRNKKRTVTVICSLTLGLVLLSCFYAKNTAFDMEKYLAELTIADFTLADASDEDWLGGYDPHGTTLNAELAAAMESADGLEGTGHLYTEWLEWELDDQTAENIHGFYTEERLAEWAAYDAQGAAEVTAALADRKATAAVYGLDGIPLESITQGGYPMRGEFDAEAFAAGGYVLAVGPAAESYDSYPVLPVPDVGSTVTLDGKAYTVMAVVSPLPPVTGGADVQGAAPVLELSFILPAQAFRANWPDNTLRRLYVNVDDAHLSQMQEWLESYATGSSLPVTSRASMAEQYEAETRSASVMGSAVSIVIAMVGILNFVNSMVTAIVSRRREFAMIQSVGMTRRQLGTMLIYEGLAYAAVTLVLSVLISSLAIGFVLRPMLEGGFSTYRFTLLPLAVCTPVLLAFAALIPLACFRNLEKQSIVERLRY